MGVFISGGCKNGKSYFAQKLARDLAIKNKVPLYYLATMKPTDDEDRNRIKRHLKERDGWGFETVEQSENILEALSKIDSQGVVLLDSVTALLANEMFGDNIDKDASKKVGKDLLKFLEKINHTVFVSDYIFSDTMKYEELTEAYRKGLAFIDKKLAQKCEKVIEVTYGNILWHKGDMNA